MKLHRFIIPIQLDKKQIRLVDKELLNQLRNVLRLKVGDKITLADGQLNEALVQIKSVSKDFVELEIVKVSKNENEPKVHGVLYAALLKRENFELVAQKATEVGIKEIVPIISKRTVKLNLRQDRLEKIIKEAAEQSNRGVVPILHEPLDFKKALEHAKQNDINLFFDPSGKELGGKFGISKTAGLWVGPEGGWDEEELQLAKEKGFKIISLGKLFFRAETAAIIASYQVVTETQ